MYLAEQWVAGIRNKDINCDIVGKDSQCSTLQEERTTTNQNTRHPFITTNKAQNRHEGLNPIEPSLKAEGEQPIYRNTWNERKLNLAQRYAPIQVPGNNLGPKDLLHLDQLIPLAIQMFFLNRAHVLKEEHQPNLHCQKLAISGKIQGITKHHWKRLARAKKQSSVVIEEVNGEKQNEGGTEKRNSDVLSEDIAKKPCLNPSAVLSERAEVASSK